MSSESAEKSDALGPSAAVAGAAPAHPALAPLGLLAHRMDRGPVSESDLARWLL